MDFENQKMIEFMFNERQASRLVEHELTACRQLMELIDRLCRMHSLLRQDYCLRLLTHIALVKRASPDALVGLLHDCFEDTHDNPWQASAQALEIAIQTDLVDFDLTHGEHGQVVVRWALDEKTEDLVRQYQYLPPMTVPPLPAGHNGNNRGGGYLTVHGDSLILQDRFNHHDGWICTDSLDKFNQVPLSINVQVVQQIRNQWSSLDKPKQDESHEDYRKRVVAFERYEKDSYLTLALMIEMGNRFHVTHKVDKRGRTYCQGYHINPQGTTWNKACIELADRELVNRN